MNESQNAGMNVCLYRLRSPKSICHPYRLVTDTSHILYSYRADRFFTFSSPPCPGYFLEAINKCHGCAILPLQNSKQPPTKQYLLHLHCFLLCVRQFSLKVTVPELYVRYQDKSVWRGSVALVLFGFSEI